LGGGVISFLIIASVLVFSGCSKQNEFGEKESPKVIKTDKILDIPEPTQNEGSVVLGRRMEDPYAIQNMQKAYASLKAAKAATPVFDIKPTHTYMRFLPKNEIELDLLKSDTTLVLYDFPLNYEIKNLGTYYHDPSLPESAITYQYCVVPVGHQIPNVQNELLYQVFIPNQELENQFLIDLEYESVRLTGNLPQGFENTKGRWTPKGTIRAWDNILSRYIPIEQVSVHARIMTHIESDLTDANGYFQTSRFRFAVNYSIKWERSLYEIRDGMFFQAWYNKSGQSRSDWNLDIGTGGKSIMFATMHRAAYKQCYADNLGIHRPSASSKAKLCYVDQPGTGVCWGDWGGGILPDIRVWGKDTDPSNYGNYKLVDEIFATTTHELGHLSHWNRIGKIQYAQTSPKVYEAWAEAVEWALTNDEYHKLGVRFNNTNAINYNCPHTNQLWWPLYCDKTYSPIFIDLMDNVNQRTNIYANGVLVWDGSTHPNDMISGYTLSYLQNNILIYSYGISSLRDAVKNHKIAGVTDAQIDELFALYWSN